MTTSTSTYPQLPAGFEPVGTGYFEPSHTPVAMSTSRPRELIAWDGSEWLAVAPIVRATDRIFEVACPVCPAPRLRRRKLPREFHEMTRNHTHGRSSNGDVQDRAPHHRGPAYLVLDVYGVLAQPSATLVGAR